MLYWFSGADITNYQQRGGFKQQKFILQQLWRQEVRATVSAGPPHHHQLWGTVSSSAPEPRGSVSITTV